MTHPVIRKIDPDAVARVQAGIRVKPEPLRHKGRPRKAETYRAYKRNAPKRRREISALTTAEGRP